ncbi:MAG: endo-1,4-beta-xylanase [Pirellulaceae bacterium]
MLVKELVPYVDSNFRTLTDQPNRAMAGLSMGGMETKLITLRNLDMFSHIGLFSGGSITMEDVNNTAGFTEKVKLVFVSYGSKEVGGGGPRRGGDPEANAKALKEAGINSHYYVSPDTAHEWQTWRRSLREIAPLLFAPEDKLSGVWKVDFDTQIGLQKYTITFGRNGQSPTASAQVAIEDRTRQVEFRDVEFDGDEISFWEPLDLNGNEIRIEFTGKISGNSIEFTRKVGEFGSGQATASRTSLAAQMETDATSARSSAPIGDSLQKQTAVKMNAEVDPNFHIYLCFGQSNMESGGRMDDTDREVDERFLVLADFDNADRGWEKNNWYHAIPPLAARGRGICMVDSFGKTLVAGLPKNVRVGVIKVSVPGCKIELFDKDSFQSYIENERDWMKNIVKGYGDNPYEYLVSMGKAAQQHGVIKGILLHQGESNTGDKAWPQKVKTVYDNLMQDLNLKPEEVPLLAGEMVNADQQGQCASMNEIVAELPKTISNAHVISSAGCPTNDRLHFNSEGSRIFGSRYGEKMLSLLRVDASTNSPQPEPVSAAPVVEVHIDRIIKDAFQSSFRIGTAGDYPARYSEQELSLAAQHFNAVTPENCMKPERVHPEEDTWRFEQSDALVDWATNNNMSVHGHTLVWHAQTRDWFFSGGDREVVTQRMKDHILNLVGRYKGKIRSWDVVNEAISDGGNAETGQTEHLRDSKWLQTLGPEFLTLAFKYAHEADPEAILYYNDYNIESGPKHASSMVLLKRLIDDGAPIHAVGIQGHWRTGSVPYDDIDKAISDYASLGLKVSITELDVTIRGASGGQFGGGFGRRRGGNSEPPSVEDLNAQAEAYGKLFAIFQKHKDVIERVTFWGLNDRRTWRFGQHPLIFDANNHPKPAYREIVNQTSDE